jgi:class 3 adenylate cyclase
MGATVASMHAAGPKAGAERRTAAILLAQLRGFARMQEALEPGLALQLAGKFFTLAGTIARSGGGEVISLRNDSVLAAFRGGDAPHVAAQAVRAAQLLQREAGPVLESWRQVHGLRCAVSLALHLGETLFGRTGAAAAEQAVALGYAAGVAERLLERARAGEFVLSHEVIKVVSPESLELDAEPLPPLELAKREPIRLYGVLLSDRLDFTS